MTPNQIKAAEIIAANRAMQADMRRTPGDLCMSCGHRASPDCVCRGGNVVREPKDG